MVAGLRVWLLQGQLYQRQFMRTKNKSAVALANVSKAWAAFYENSEPKNEEALAEQGWKSIRAISNETKTTISSSACRVDLAVRKGLFEVKKLTIQTNHGVRLVNLYRPILKQKRPQSRSSIS